MKAKRRSSSRTPFSYIPKGVQIYMESVKEDIKYFLYHLSMKSEFGREVKSSQNEEQKKISINRFLV